MNVNYLCPVCGERLKRNEHSYKCKNGHSFDISRKGYVNLLTTKGRSPQKAGDNKEMIRARGAFLDTGLYEPLAQKIGQLAATLTEGIKEPVIIDSGCGEGYYTCIYSALNERAQLFGIDLSKHGIDAAASRARVKALDNIRFAVASAFSLPFREECADVVISCFAPVSNDEYARVLKKGGALIIASPTERHLFGLKSVLYDKPYENEPNKYALNKFSLKSTERLEYEGVLGSGEEIMALFTMTPYYYKTSAEAAERLRALDTLKTEIGFEIRTYIKL
ncbi:MAG: methyltransferase domain-containing protein [Ruminococcus sp.]|nr:methyltransferase domain-containing protein [Ruminococcus sp.]